MPGYVVDLVHLRPKVLQSSKATLRSEILDLKGSFGEC